MLTGHRQVIDADLSKYFDIIPHAKLMAVVAERISGKAALALIKQWLKAPVVTRNSDGKWTISGGKRNSRGTPQGGVISPLLANLYLHLLDRIWERRNLARYYRARIVRYADDLVILCKGGVERPLRVLEAVLERCDLRLNEKKTRIVNSYQEDFDFLGFNFKMRRSRKSGKYYPHVEPSARAIKRIKARVKDITHRRRTPVPLPLLVSGVNQAVRGWSGYFHYGHSTKVMSRVKWFTEERVCKHLRKRYKVRTRTQGYSRFTTVFLYDKLGLYKIPTNAKWRQAHAL